MKISFVVVIAALLLYLGFRTGFLDIAFGKEADEAIAAWEMNLG